MRYVDELTDAVRSQLALAYGIKDQLGSALRARLREGYGLADLRADARAGLAVALLALPLSMALARTTGVAPQHGLYTAIIAGIVVSLLGGSRMQVTGPTAAFVVILEPIVARHGLGGLLVAGVMAGCILVLMGVARLGKLMQFIPHPVTTGFTTGIAVVLVVLASRDALGLELAGRPSGTIEFIGAVWDARAGGPRRRRARVRGDAGVAGGAAPGCTAGSPRRWSRWPRSRRSASSPPTWSTASRRGRSARRSPP
jgi:hypothetical protein